MEIRPHHVIVALIVVIAILMAKANTHNLGSADVVATVITEAMAANTYE
ncbi:hypothetical protein HON52_01870 [Candidatus Uhrbacteria bacterium]|nr:hypothetical protein [Candidatus Uhrbacteria bacterium]